jgi:hypothetical protein
MSFGLNIVGQISTSLMYVTKISVCQMSDDQMA